MVTVDDLGYFPAVGPRICDNFETVRDMMSVSITD